MRLVRDPDDGLVTIAIGILAICRVFAYHPVNRRRGIGIRAEYHEIVIPLTARAVNAFLVVQGEYRKRIAPMQWQAGISALDVSDIWIGAVGASRFAHVAVVEPEIPGGRERDGGSGSRG